MKAQTFEKFVANLVAKTAGQPIEVVDPEANVLSYHDEGMTEGEQVACAHLAAAEVLFENGYLQDLEG